MSENLPTSHKGKIGSLPADLREEVNRRLHDGQTGKEICDWLNAEPRVLEVLDERWNEQPITPQNLSEWRKGGYQIYLKRISRSAHLKTLADWSISIAEEIPVEKMTGAAQRILAGQLLDKLEDMEEGEAILLMEALGDLTLSVDRTVKNEIAKNKLALQREQVDTRKEELALQREKFEVATVEQFLKWQGTDEAKRILESGKPKQVQTELLREMMFGKIAKEDE